MPTAARSKARVNPAKKSGSCCKKPTAGPSTLEVTLAGCQHRVCYSCLAKTCSKALKDSLVATCWACSKEIALNQVSLVLSRSAFASYMSQYRTGNTARLDCASCFGKKDLGVLKVGPCGHHYCDPCLRRMCRLALGDRALMPLRCCKKELPQDYVREALTKPDYEKYCKLMTERDWKISDLQSDAEYTATVRSLGAKQCPGCGIGVQRDFGCVHMTCPNGHQFCYTCVRTWGSCNCPLIPDAELRQILGE